MSLFLTAKEAAVFISVSEKYDYEVAFHFGHNEAFRATRFMIRTDRNPNSVNVAFTFATINGHTHPSALYKDKKLKFHPMTGLDVVGSSLNTPQWNLVFEKGGVWAHRLSQALFREFRASIKAKKNELLSEVLFTNASEYGACLAGSQIYSDCPYDIHSVDEYIRRMDVHITNPIKSGKKGEGIIVKYFPLGTDVVLEPTNIPACATYVALGLQTVMVYDMDLYDEDAMKIMIETAVEADDATNLDNNWLQFLDFSGAFN